MASDLVIIGIFLSIGLALIGDLDRTQLPGPNEILRYPSMAEVYRQFSGSQRQLNPLVGQLIGALVARVAIVSPCLLYTSDAADE